MASIARAAATIKAQGAGFITEERTRSACVAAGHAWRRRLLGPVETLQLFVLQVLAGNVACRAVTLLAGRAFTPQAYCDARMRLPLDVFGFVAAGLIDDARRATASGGGFGRWLGHRVFHVDGSGVSMPDTQALRAAYGQPQQPGKPGFPVMHVLWLFDAATGLICDFVESSWNTHDLADAAKLHPSLESGDVLVGDRAFGSYAHLALLQMQGIFGLFRLHQKRSVDFTPRSKSRHQRPKKQRKGAPTSRWITSLGREDQLVELRRPARRPTWMNDADYDRLPQTLVVRELFYTLTRRGFRTREVTLVTTLIDPRTYCKEALVELYGARWDIETNLRHLKQTMGMDVLHCTTREGVLKELWVHLMVYNRVRLAMLDAARRQGVPPDRISFIDALDVLRHRPIDAPDLPLIVNPRRPGRHEPRVIKRRKDRYTYLTKPRDQLRQQLGISRHAA